MPESVLPQEKDALRELRDALWGCFFCFVVLLGQFHGREMGRRFDVVISRGKETSFRLPCWRSLFGFCHLSLMLLRKSGCLSSTAEEGRGTLLVCDLAASL
ncbi:MAG: hypothetical protein IJ599_05425 [Alphaproteobacteria bacterium]|nr:hypothetical protein [Alphaproteobacteria bacterium]